MRVLVLNGPNLNMLGVREPSIYGKDTLQDLMTAAAKRATELGLMTEVRQSNHEGDLVTWIQQARTESTEKSQLRCAAPPVNSVSSLASVA